MSTGPRVSSITLKSLTPSLFQRLHRWELEIVASQIRGYLLRRLTPEEWVLVCKAIRMFAKSSNLALRATLQRELTAILQANVARLDEMQVGSTLELVRDLLPNEDHEPPPTSPAPYSPVSQAPMRGGFSVKSKAAAAVEGATPREPVAVGWHSSAEVLDTYKDNSVSDRCQNVINGIIRAMSKGEYVCLLSGETFLSTASFNSHTFSKKLRNLQLGNPGIPNMPPTPDQMRDALETCKLFLKRMKPVNDYVDHFSHVLKVEYETERTTLLQRLSYNDEWDRFRLEHDGVSYFGMKLAGSFNHRSGETFVKSTGSSIPFSSSIVPGQSVWVSAEDAPVVDPVDKRVTGMGEVASIGRESIVLRGLTGLPLSKNGLYRIDYAVTPINLERMIEALAIIRQHYEWKMAQDPIFRPWVAICEDDQPTYRLGVLEPGTPLARFFFHNIHHSIATARSYYRTRFGAVVPHNLPERPNCFNSYEPPPAPIDGPPLTPVELNAAMQQKHPSLNSSGCQPLDCSNRPLHRSQHWLNDNQLVAMTKVMDEARQVTLIQGPPGTGKTTTAIAIICEWVMWYHNRILATAHSNKGVDNLLQGLVDKGIKVLRVGRGAPGESADLGEYCLDTLVDRHPLNARREELQAQLKEAHRTGQASAIREFTSQVDKLSRQAIGRHIVKEAEVVCATCVGVGSQLMQGLQFDLVLVDEATQAVEPSSMIPITRGAKQLVMIGDQAQLPPTSKCLTAQMMGLDISLFDRLIGNGVECHVLDMQYRMHPTISCFPSWRFYHSLLRDGVTAMDRLLPNGVFPTPNSRVCFLEVAGQEEQVGTSKLNRCESSCIMWMIKQLAKQGNVKLSQIGVITPYAAQVRIVTQAVRAAFGDSGAADLEVHSVDGFQGREKDFIMLSMVRTKVGGDLTFITDWRRTNVALTRARYGVVVVGCASALCQSSIWLDWLKFHQSCLLTWDANSQALSPVHPELIEHIQSMNATLESSTMEEVLAQKLWSETQAASAADQTVPTPQNMPNGASSASADTSEGSKRPPEGAADGEPAAKRPNGVS